MADNLLRSSADTIALGSEENLCSDGRSGSSCEEDGGVRSERRFIPNEEKDEFYWAKRRKNNEAARRSREKRRANDQVLERQILSLLEENTSLRAELLALRFRLGLVKEPSEGPLVPFRINRQALSFQSPRGAAPGSAEVPTSSLAFDEFAHSPAEGVAPRAGARESLKRLPHKLRFKAPGGDSTHDSRPRGPPVAMVGPNIHPQATERPGWDHPGDRHPDASAHSCREGEHRSLQAQLSSLSQEVTELRTLFSQQLVPKMA